MLHRMRFRLAIYFMCLALVLHLAGSVASIFLIHSGLSRSMDTLLTDLVAEIRPSIQVADGHPTLKAWATRAKEEKPILATIQLFAADGTLLEQYGPPGVDRLSSGIVAERRQGGLLEVRSTNEEVRRGGKTMGYLQVQASTRQNHRIVDYAIEAAVLAIPLLMALVAFAGYWYAGIALRPVEQTMRLLRRFVADAGHELNTPVAIISASLETLQEVLKEHKIEDSLTDTIAKANARMSELASDLVFLARVEDPVSAYAMDTLQLDPLVEDVVTDFQTLADSKNLHLELKPLPKVEIVGNAEFLRRMLSNLISNCMRYTDAGGTVSVSVDLQGTQVEIRVSDTGIGIPPESIEHIFDRFYRVDKARARAAGGAGLGLSIVKAVVDAHGGDVHVESKLGEGSIFYVILPLTRRPL